MREQDRFDWNDEDFESLADETESPDDMDVESLGEDTSMISDEAMDQELSEESSDLGSTSGGQELKMEDSDQKATQLHTTGGGISGVGLGLLFGFSTLVASLGLGGAMLYALGGNPLSLWDPSGLTRIDQLFNYQDHPLNVLYVVGASTILLAILGSWAVSRATAKANHSLKSVEDLLRRVCSLRLDNEASWQNPAFKKDVAASSFVDETLGAWRLSQTRQKKYLGLEGELVRLQKAIEGNQRADLSGSFENHLAGSLADEVSRLFDERERALQEAGAIKSKDQHDSESIIGIIQDARSWNRKTLDQVGVQGATLDRVAARLDQFKKECAALGQSMTTEKDIAVVADLRARLDDWKQSSKPGAAAGDMGALLDRGNKLAFQIAMEVARLGTRGERLLPMTQSLDELNTEMRQLSLGAGASAGNEKDAQWLQLLGQLDDLSASLADDGRSGLKKLDATAGELAPVAANIGEQLAGIARSFNQQGDRLKKLGEACSELTGVEFKSDSLDTGKADNPPEGGLNITQFDPFGREDIAEPLEAEVDPFSTGEVSLSDDLGFERSGDFSNSVLPGEDLPLISQEIEEVLSSEEEKVYDLAEFGAVRIGSEILAAASEPEEEVYDLSDFGAVTIS